MEMYRPDSNLDWNHVTQKRLSIFSLKYVAAKLENLAPDGTEKLIHDPEDIKLLMGTGMTETEAEVLGGSQRMTGTESETTVSGAVEAETDILQMPEIRIRQHRPVILHRQTPAVIFRL